MSRSYYKIIWIVTLFVLILPLAAIAQSMTNTERRRMNLAILEAIEKYEMSSTLQGDYAKYDFLDLFEDPNTRIYCDLLDYTSEDGKITVAEYADLLLSKKLVDTSIRQVRKSEPIQQENGWSTSIAFKKRLNYLDKNGVWFSSDEYYKSEYDLIATFIYNPDNKTCYISNIEGDISSDQDKLPTRFIVIQASEKVTSQDSNNVYYIQKKNNIGKKTTEELQFNSFQQAFVNNINDISAWSDNINIKTDTIATTTNYDLVSLVSKKSIVRAKAYYGMTIGDFYSITSEAPASVSAKSSAFEYGVDFGVTFSLGRAAQMGLFVGAAMQHSDISFSYKQTISYEIPRTSYTPTENQFNTNDIAKSYTHKYTITSIEEGIKYNHIVLPAYIELEHRLAKGFYFTWSIGAKFYFNKNTTIDQPYHITGSAVQTNENGQSTSQDISGDYTNMLFPTKYALESDIIESMSAIGSAGFDINLYKRHIFLSIKATYEYGIGDVHTSDNLPLFNNNQKFYPIIYDSTTDEHIATRSFMGSTSFKRQAIWVKGGLTFKF